MIDVSVVVPVYNSEKYLRRCIDSILNQTYNNLEIILIDDGSIDNSSKICDEYSKAYNNVRVLHKRNEGLGMARNDGIVISKGKYIIFIDSDDWIDMNLVEQLIYYKNIYKVSTVISGLKRVDTKGDIKDIENKYEELQFYGEDVKRKLLPRIIGRSPEKKDGLAVSSCAVLYSRNIIQKNNIKFESERKYLAEDLLFNIDYYGKCDSVCIIPIYGYNYFMNVGTLTTKYRLNRTEKYIDLYYEERKKLESLGIYDLCFYRLSCQYFLRIRNCIKQEQISISGYSKKDAIVNIKNICKTKLYRELIKSYPVYKLGAKRALFLFLVLTKASYLLYYLAKFM